MATWQMRPSCGRAKLYGATSRAGHPSRPTARNRAEGVGIEGKGCREEGSKRSGVPTGRTACHIPALGEPSKLSRSNPGTRCFACEERGATSGLEATAAREVVELRKTEDLRQSEEHTEAGSAREVWERRKRSVLTCERGLHSALASG